MTIFDVIRYSKPAVQCIRVTLYRFGLVYDLDGRVDRKDNTICKISRSGVMITLLSHVQIRYTDTKLPLYNNWYRRINLIFSRLIMMKKCLPDGLELNLISNQNYVHAVILIKDLPL